MVNRDDIIYAINSTHLNTKAPIHANCKAFSSVSQGSGRSSTFQINELWEHVEELFSPDLLSEFKQRILFDIFSCRIMEQCVARGKFVSGILRRHPQK